MSVRSQSAFLRKAGTLTVWLIIFCIYFLGVYNYVQIRNDTAVSVFCLLYTSDAADEEDSVDLGGRRIIKKKKNERNGGRSTRTEKTKEINQANK